MVTGSIDSKLAVDNGRTRPDIKCEIHLGDSVIRNLIVLAVNRFWRAFSHACSISTAM